MDHLAVGLRRTAQPFRWTTPARLSQPRHFFEGQYRSFYTTLLFAEICNGLVNVYHDVLNSKRFRLPGRLIFMTQNEPRYCAKMLIVYFRADAFHGAGGKSGRTELARPPG
jgi:hypothetical protein